MIMYQEKKPENYTEFTHLNIANRQNKKSSLKLRQKMFNISKSTKRSFRSTLRHIKTVQN